MFIFHLKVLEWDGDEWLTTHQAVVVEKNEQCALKLFKWSEGMNREIILIGKAEKGVSRQIVMREDRHDLERAIESARRSV